MIILNLVGGYYNAYEDKFIAGLGLFSEEQIASNNKTIYHPYQDTKWTSQQTLYEKIDLLKIHLDGSVRVKLSFGEITAGGSFDYLSDEKVWKHYNNQKLCESSAYKKI